MATRLDLEANYNRRPGGASYLTMLLWHLIDASGEAGITRDELYLEVEPHINLGHAKRRYLAQRKSQHRYDAARRAEGANGSAPSAAPPTWENIDDNQARQFIIRETLTDMRKLGSVRRDGFGRYRTLRKPQAARYARDDAVIDPTGARTRLHMNITQATRTLKPALERRRQSPRARLSETEWRALETLIEHAITGIQTNWRGRPEPNGP